MSSAIVVELSSSGRPAVIVVVVSSLDACAGVSLIVEDTATLNSSTVVLPGELVGRFASLVVITAPD